ncbi:MAG: CHAP domain-containing protein [Gordonia sp. (in: high G+C Gram-positive bacteria)]|uniref:CHAP domain-containing protein n=1 Tax=Gordonia sp. (in: high G+C Gram-positive bacteria) TaxID=84139 RepID=UPI0039E2975B
MSTTGRRAGSRILALVVIATVVAAALVAWQEHDRIRRALGLRPPFPTVDTTALTPTRRRIIEVLRAEYDDPQPGEYYAEGITEPWCADFVSTTMRRAGVPLTNPNSGTWRIPGVATLTDYYRSTGRFRGPQYLPKPGDVALYQSDSKWGQHTNIVVVVDGGRVTTVGGNEPGGIGVQGFDHATERGVVGYGRPR